MGARHAINPAMSARVRRRKNVSRRHHFALPHTVVFAIYDSYRFCFLFFAFCVLLFGRPFFFFFFFLWYSPLWLVEVVVLLFSFLDVFFFLRFFVAC